MLITSCPDMASTQTCYQLLSRVADVDVSVRNQEAHGKRIIIADKVPLLLQSTSLKILIMLMMTMMVMAMTRPIMVMLMLTVPRRG